MARHAKPVGGHHVVIRYASNMHQSRHCHSARRQCLGAGVAEQAHQDYRQRATGRSDRCPSPCLWRAYFAESGSAGGCREQARVGKTSSEPRRCAGPQESAAIRAQRKMNPNGSTVPRKFLKGPKPRSASQARARQHFATDLDARGPRAHLIIVTSELDYCRVLARPLQPEGRMIMRMLPD